MGKHLQGTCVQPVSNFVKSEIPAQVSEENHPILDLQYRIIVENTCGGSISRVDPDGTVKELGQVTIPAGETYIPADGFWAAQYSRSQAGHTGAVVATGVNAMHLRVGPEEWYDPENAQLGRDTVWKPQLISLLPDREYHKAGSGPHPGRIATNIPGGKKLFGGVSSAYVGSAVKYCTADDKWKPIETFYRHHGYHEAPDKIMIEVCKPSTVHGEIEAIVFENEVGGEVRIEYKDGFCKTVATVIQRVEGTGRFGGSEYADVGYVRANHGGVLDLSTSPYTGFTWDIEQRGGFQIIPANHAVYSRHFLDANYIDRPQYMIIGSIDSSPERLLEAVYYDENGLAYEPHWEAVAPLFSMYIKPKYVTNHDQLPENANREKVPEKGIKGQSTHYQLSFDGGTTWTDPEPKTGVHDDSLIDVTHIKLFLKF